MTDKKKRLARELSKKTGMSHQAAVNVLDKPVAHPQRHNAVSASSLARSGAIDWRELRALRAAAVQLVTPDAVAAAFAATHSAMKRREAQEARPDYDLFRHGQIDIPSVDAQWYSRLLAVTRGLAACLRSEESLPPATSEFWSTGWITDPEKLRPLTFVQHLRETADFLLTMYDAQGD